MSIDFSNAQVPYVGSACPELQQHLSSLGHMNISWYLSLLPHPILVHIE